MAPPLAPWLRPVDNDALNRGLRMGFEMAQAKQNQKRAAEMLRLQQEQMESLNRWRQAQDQARMDANALRAQALEQASVKAEQDRASREMIAAQNAASREKLAGAANALRNRARIQELPSGDIWRFNADGTEEVIPRETFATEDKPLHVGQTLQQRNRDTGEWEIVSAPVPGLSTVEKLELIDLFKTKRDLQNAISNAGTDEQKIELKLRLDATGKAINAYRNKDLQPKRSVLPSQASAGSALIAPSLLREGFNSTNAPSMTAPQFESAPADIKLRKQGQVYQTPRGQFRWTGTGWTQVGQTAQSTPASAPLIRQPVLPEPAIGTNQIPMSIDAGPYDAMRQPVQTDLSEDDIDRLLRQMIFEEDGNDIDTAD